MRYRTFGKTGWQVSEVGYGMWGMGAWSGSDDDESAAALDRAIELGCNFFDTAWVYGLGKSERLLRGALKRHRDTVLRIATKIPPKNMAWPAARGVPLDEVYPADHVRAYTEKSLENLGVETIDLQQFHVWNDEWGNDVRWPRVVAALKDEGLVRAFGISVNRWEPTNVLLALASGVVDSVQVVYNLFDQAAEDVLFPFCQARDIAIIARVPFDEGSLTGTLTTESRWPDEDWRSRYFTATTLPDTLRRVDRLRTALPDGMSLPELALRFVLHHPAVTTVIPGMRRVRHVEGNLAVSDGRELPRHVVASLRAHRWNRTAPPGPL
jgi:aryl-alcohol dehydrogenase-like predicted oxidoreductase